MAEALIGWYQLPARSQGQIHDTLAQLAEQPVNHWQNDEVEAWRPDEQLFALHAQVGPDHLLVFFRPEGDRVRLLDMVLKETIDRYFTPKNGA